MTAHELLIEARDSIATEGWDIQTYGLWGADTDDACGTPRCALGWMSWCARDYIGFHMFLPERGSAYEQGLEALWGVRPESYEEDSDEAGIALDVEDVAFHIDRYKAEGLGGILAWFGRAIAATAPAALPDVELDDTLVAV